MILFRTIVINRAAICMGNTTVRASMILRCKREINLCREESSLQGREESSLLRARLCNVRATDRNQLKFNVKSNGKLTTAGDSY